MSFNQDDTTPDDFFERASEHDRSIHRPSFYNSNKSIDERLLCNACIARVRENNGSPAGGVVRNDHFGEAFGRQPKQSFGFDDFAPSSLQPSSFDSFRSKPGPISNTITNDNVFRSQLVPSHSLLEETKGHEIHKQQSSNYPASMQN